MTTNMRIALWLGFAVVLTYISSIGGAFHFDDTHSIVSNPAVHSLENIPAFWGNPAASSLIPENRAYRPLTYTFYSICWAIGGGKVWPFHIAKIMMHWMVCVLLFLIWRHFWSLPGWFPIQSLQFQLPRFSKSVSITPQVFAFLLALIYAVHPTLSECVNYIAATPSLQCAMFYLLGFYTYLVYRTCGCKGYLWSSLVFYFCSIASKEEGITLPLMVLVTEAYLSAGALRIRLWSSFYKSIPYIIVGLLFGLWMYVMHPVEGNQSRGHVSSFNYFITQWRAYLWYMRLWFWPFDLNADNTTVEFSKSVFDPLVIQAALGNLLIIFSAWLMRKKFPALLYGLLWFYITISPASSVVVLAEAINEHRMYLAYIGFVGGTFVLVLWFAQQVLQQERSAKILGTVYPCLLLALFVGTQQRNMVWHNSENLWLDTIGKNPTSGRAYNNLALVYLERGEYGKAIGLLEKCEQYWPAYLYCPLNKGISYQALNNLVEAEKAFSRAYQLGPRSTYVNFYLGKFYKEMKKDYQQATVYLQAANQLNGGNYEIAKKLLEEITK